LKYAWSEWVVYALAVKDGAVDGGCGCGWGYGWGCGWGYCAAAAARAAQQFNLRFVRNLRNARRQGAWPSTVQLSTVQYGLRAWVRVT